MPVGPEKKEETFFDEPVLEPQFLSREELTGSNPEDFNSSGTPEEISSPSQLMEAAENNPGTRRNF